MEAVKPKKKRKTKSKQKSQASEEGSTVETIGATPGPVQETAESAPSEDTRTRQESEIVVNKSRVDDDEESTSKPDDDLCTPVSESQPVSDIGIENMATADSKTSEKISTETESLLKSDSKTEKIEEVKSKPLVTESSNEIAEPEVVSSEVISDHVTEVSNQITEPEVVSPEVISEASNQIEEQNTQTSTTELINLDTMNTKQLSNQIAESSHVTEQSSNQIVEPSAPALIPISEETAVERLLYPRLDSITKDEEFEENLEPFSEEDLALLYPNRQLDANQIFIDNFVSNCHQERHPLFELLMTFLKAKQALTSAHKEVAGYQGQYHTHQPLVWSTETKDTVAYGKCADGSKVTHSHSHKFAVYSVEHGVKVSSALKGIRETIHERLCMRSYSSQLARIHIDNFLFKVVNSYPELSVYGGDAPVTNWVPNCPPSELNPHTASLRDCISVLFIFERRPVQDKEFSKDCRNWLDLLLSALLRVATLSDHRFIMNHLLRCPPGVAKWAVKYIHVPSPLATRQLLESQFPTGVDDGLGWAVDVGLHGNWGGPLVNHFITTLSTMLSPIQDRESLLSSFELHECADSAENPGSVTRQISAWTFVETSDEDECTDTVDHKMLKEDDFISFFDQFDFNKLFQHIISGSSNQGEYNIDSVTSSGVMRLFAFGSSLIRLLGGTFTTLKSARYKEFIKQVGRTIRQTVQYIADMWVLYKANRTQSEAMPPATPIEESISGSRYTLSRLQLEFDQFVLRATRWILSAHRLGAWQFLADMPYSSISSSMVWQIFWNIYCKQSSDDGNRGDGDADQRVVSPCTVVEIQDALKDPKYKDLFVDGLMTTYTSEAVFLLTTLVNIARARPTMEEELINTIVLEIFECTQVIEFSKDAYSRTGHTLLDSVAIVHPFIITTLLKRVESVISLVGENCILLFKELPLHLWVPTSHDLHVITTWLINNPLSSFENLLARNILSGLNWGTRSEEGSCDLVLPWSTHCLVALAIVEAHTQHLPTQPGGRDYSPSSGIGKYASLHRYTTTTEQLDYVKWAWELALMMKLHPNQVLLNSMQTLNPDGQSSQNSSSSAPPWVRMDASSEQLTLPDLTSSSERELADLRDAVHNEGLLAYYVALCVSSIGTDTTHFLSNGLTMVRQLLAEGYYLPVLRILGNVTPRFFNHRDLLLQEEGFIQVIVTICNADLANASLREKWTYATPTHLVTKKMAALIQTQLQGACGPTGVGGEKVLDFWLGILLACPSWYRERSLLHLLDSLALATHGHPDWQRTVQGVLLEAFKGLKSSQASKSGLVSAVASSISYVLRQEGGGASLFTAIQYTEYPWLSFHMLCAEQSLEEDSKVWQTLLKILKKDPKLSIDSALKRCLSELNSKSTGVSYTSFWSSANNLAIYKWAEFAASLDHTHSVLPLVWQRFFMLYLQRPILDSGSMPERESQGLRFFSAARQLSLRKRMRTALSSTCKELKEQISKFEAGEVPHGEIRELLRTHLPKSLGLYQTLRLWLEEPRLHSAELYLPGLPPQYDSARLAAVFKYEKTFPWMEFVPIWEVKGQLNGLIDEWIEIANYQKNLGSKVQTPESSPDFALTRLQARLNKSSGQIVQPPRFVYINPPVAMVTREALLDRDVIVGVVKNDLQIVFEQARAYCTKLEAVTTLDQQYTEGLPNLYSNEPKQFHVKVPCHSRFNRSHQCKGEATIVFRIEEMTIQPRWEQDLGVNRNEYRDMIGALSKPVPPELCQLVMKLENTVAELAAMAAQTQDLYPNVPLQNGIALFYEILGFVGQNTRNYPPSRQVLTACLQILGQEFIQRGPLQTSNILNQLLSVRGNSDILVPLFSPNLSPDQFINMYCTAAELAVKDNPAVAFAVLTKFNIPAWLGDYDPNINTRSQLLQYVSQGLCLSGHSPSRENSILVELYRRHLGQLIEFKFPDQYSEALRMIINCTDNASIAIDVWSDLREIIGSHDHDHGSHAGHMTRLALSEIQDSIRVLSSNYTQRKLTSNQTLYSLINEGYVPVIGEFIKTLCTGLVVRTSEAITMGTTDHNQAVEKCWCMIVEAFSPWVTAMETHEGQLWPCLEVESPAMAGVLELFVSVVTMATRHLGSESYESIMTHVWSYYYSTLVNPLTSPLPLHLTYTYHSQLRSLPWESFSPDLVAMETMLKLRLLDSYSRDCFVFLGRVFPRIDWKKIAADYHSVGNADNASVKFHVMILQLLVMIAAESEVMNDQDTHMPEAIADAHDFHWENIDSKTFSDLISWQKTNCDPPAVLYSGSCLFLSLRLLKSAAGFPSNNGPPEIPHKDTWEKRLAYINLVVDLIGRSTLKTDCLSHDYTYALTHLYQTAVDVCVHEYPEFGQIVPLLQAVLNVFTSCQSSDKVMDMLMTITFDILDQLPNAHLLTLPIVTASCRSIHSIRCMVKVIEHAILCHFKAVPKPHPLPAELPRDPLCMYGWKSVIETLVTPEEIVKEFCQKAIEQFSVLALHGHLLSVLPRCTSLAEEARIGSKIVAWCTQVKLPPDNCNEAKMILLWEKALGLILRQIRYGGNYVSEAPPLLNSLASSMVRYGEDKASDGLLGAIGFGKKSKYTYEFRLVSRVMSAFLYCQMPMDTSQVTHLRVVPNAPGLVRETAKSTPIIPGTKLPTKQAEQALNNLEHLLVNKNYSHLRESTASGVEFIKDASHSLMDANKILVTLSTSLYPDYRFLDLLKVFEV